MILLTKALRKNLAGDLGALYMEIGDLLDFFGILLANHHPNRQFKRTGTY